MTRARKVKAVEAWGIVTAEGRLCRMAAYPKSLAKMHCMDAGDRIIRVRITPIRKRGGK